MPHHVAVSEIQSRIYTVRGCRAIMDSDLARLYGVTTRRLNEQVARNSERFPEHFCFRLTVQEFEQLKPQFHIKDQKRNGGKRIPPNMFREQGAMMAATVLSTPVAKDVSISIVDAFTKLKSSSVNNGLNNVQIETIVANVVTQVLQKLNVGSKPYGYVKSKSNSIGNGPQIHKKEDSKTQTIEKVVCEYFNVTPKELRGPKRTKSISEARQIAIFLMRKHSTLSFKEIANHFERKDHTTVMHACRKLELVEDTDSALQEIEQKLSLNQSTFNDTDLH